MSDTGHAAIDSVLQENRLFQSPGAFSAHAHVPDRARYETLYRWSMDDPENFWREMATRLRWMAPFDRVLDWQPPFAQWFLGGRTVMCRPSGLINRADREVGTATDISRTAAEEFNGRKPFSALLALWLRWSRVQIPWV
jgi:acetyl-CoA synthetase